MNFNFFEFYFIIPVKAIIEFSLIDPLIDMVFIFAYVVSCFDIRISLKCMYNKENKLPADFVYKPTKQSLSGIEKTLFSNLKICVALSPISLSGK